MGSLKIWTVGHSTRSLDELLLLLKAAAIESLIDVRAFPSSRRHPQFNRESIESFLNSQGIRYRWEGSNFGGFRKPRPDSRNTLLRNEAFRGYADYMETGAFVGPASRLVAEAHDRRLALMCAEQHASRCHRRLISDWLAAHDVDVVHILNPGCLEPHTVTAGAVVAAGTVAYPGARGLPF